MVSVVFILWKKIYNILCVIHFITFKGLLTMYVLKEIINR